MLKPQIMSLFISLIFLSLITISHSQQWYQRNNPHFINHNDFDNLVINQQTRSKGVTFLKYFTPWCRYCRFLKDIMDNIKAQAQWNINFLDINCDQTNYQFCGQMGVRSFPKLSIFQNGHHLESIDGFYPYQIIKDLFNKYNRTNGQTHQQAHNIESHETKQEQVKKQIQPKTVEEPNFVQPIIVIPQKVQINQPQNDNVQANQQPKVIQQHKQELKTISNQNTNPNPSIEQHKKDSIQEKQPQTPKILQQHKKQVQKPKRPEQFVEQEQNIAVVDQNVKEIQKQKQIIEKITHQKKDTIDLTKTHQSTDQSHKFYAKYAIYAICLLVGGYYFVHIMKSQPDSNNLSHNSSHSKQSSFSNKNSSISRNISIEDSQLKEQINFQHPQQQDDQNNSNQDIQVNDEDL